MSEFVIIVFDCSIYNIRYYFIYSNLFLKGVILVIYGKKVVINFDYFYIYGGNKVEYCFWFIVNYNFKKWFVIWNLMSEIDFGDNCFFSSDEFWDWKIYIKYSCFIFCLMK